ncbi:uncharacterized protein APUU_60365S [Aspergillus puulaauensis]|uniref:mRNA stability protein n=1 Tax=Aspergillus puulaauensis TaxID=1220207 RepID=A0A7R7XTY1_9EURO|nr:uncharacterized protein APUU_60365S [Aspergillus puulaauensis]BCS27317.1 hypothetical protein APUU_60365S [Aspergillus puulaauensis]
MQSGDKVPCPESMTKSEKYHFSKYGKLPSRGLLDKRSHERTYFDSGDFALSATDHMSDDGAIQTGTEHPHRDSISHPYAPIPAASNVGKDANEDVNRKSIVPESSPLLQQKNWKNGELGAA